MDFGKYIHELLLENDTVIIPGLGAFISEYKPAEINDESGEITPPSKSISFTTQIRNNDGLLVGHVAEKSRISHFDALKKIEKERENILYKLDSGEEFEIKEVGVLSSSDSGEIQFFETSEDNISLDSFGLEAASVVIEEPEVEEEQPVPAEANDVPEEPKPQVEEILIEDHVEEEVAEVEEPALVEEKPKDDISVKAPIEEEKEEEPIQEEEEEESVVLPPVFDETPAEEEKKKRRWWLILLILIPLIAISVFAFLKKDELGFGKENDQPQIEINETEEPESIAADTVLSDSVSVPKQDTTLVLDTLETKVIEEEPIQDQTAASTKFYLVGGSFKEEANAETYLQELKSKGFNPFHLGKYGSFFVVGIGAFNSEEEANQAKTKYLKQNPGSGVWILER